MSPCILLSESGLREWVALIGGLLIPGERLRIVLLDAQARIIKLAEAGLRRRIAGVGSPCQNRDNLRVGAARPERPRELILDARVTGVSVQRRLTSRNRLCWVYGSRQAARRTNRPRFSIRGCREASALLHELVVFVAC